MEGDFLSLDMENMLKLFTGEKIDMAAYFESDLADAKVGVEHLGHSV